MADEHDALRGGSAKTAPAGAAFGPEVLRDHARASHLEWLLTDGAGGFAMGTAAGTNTRRYHGLFVPALRPPVDRHVLLSRIDERVAPQQPGLPWVSLASNQYPGVIDPAGYRRLVQFRLDPFPVWTFDVGGAHLEKSLFLVQGERTAVVQYRATRRRRLLLAPFLAFRDYHALTRANAAFNAHVAQERRVGALVLRTRPYDALPELRLHASRGATFEQSGVWFYDNEYLAELARGFDFREDLVQLGTLELEVAPGSPAFVVATLGEGRFDAAAVAAAEAAERARLTPRELRPFAARLGAAADQFVVRRASGSSTLLAGYPWFTDWGRDAMIALPGALLSLGRLDEAREVLRGFLAHLDGGLIPNRFPDSAGERPEYNTADATLWLFQAARAWRGEGGDPQESFLREVLYPAAQEILACHRRGTHHGIRVDPADGLLAAGAPGLALTWMDARVDSVPATPRAGKPVEINALWFNALKIAAEWARALGDEREALRLETEAAAAKSSFRRAFWNEARGCLYDVIGGAAGPDASVRPNQLFAASLPFALLEGDRLRSMLAVIEAELLTPVGLRTLSPHDPAYLARYEGGPAQRDAAYHQGTVWPFLLGPYVRAVLAARGRSAETLARCRALLAPFERHLAQAEAGCISSLPEIYDAEPPHLPRGAPAQAWSVAELLRLATRELA